MINRKKYKALIFGFFVLLLGVLRLSFAYNTRYESIKWSIEKSAVGNNSIKPWEKLLHTNIPNPSSNFKYQNRAYLESGTIDNTRYIFEKGKIKTPIVDGVTVSKDQFVRHYFLKMWKNNAAYFWNNGSTLGWWYSVDPSGSIISESTLFNFLNNSDYNSSWLNFITVK